MLTSSDLPDDSNLDIAELMDYLEGVELRFEVTGDIGVGKSAMVIRYTQDFFEEEGFELKMEESCIKKVVINVEGQKRSSHVYLDIHDSVDDNEKYNIWGHFEQSIQGFLLCFSVTDRKSYNYITTRIARLERILQKPKDKIPIVLVGTKIDLVDERAVEYSEALELAELLNVPYFETSSKTGENVEDAINELVRKIFRECSIYRASKSNCSIL